MSTTFENQHEHLAERSLTWSGCQNVRDFGELAISAERNTQFGRIVRADCLGWLDAAGRKAMHEYGIRTNIDLRAPWESAEFNSNVTQHEDGFPLPIYMNIALEELPRDVTAALQRSNWSMGESKHEAYCAMLDHCKERIALIVKAIADARDGGVVVHCYAGQDRTGIVSALLLSLTGVPDSDVVADYTLSQEMLKPRRPPNAMEDVVFKPDAIPESMRRFLAHLQQSYGSAASYLRNIGLPPTIIERLRRRLTDQ